MTVWIYGLRHPITSELRYVGKTAQGIERRFRQHITNSENGKAKDRPIGRWIAKLRREGLLPEVFVFEELPDGADWAAAEQKWIAESRADGARLLNLTSGGEGLTGYDPPPEVRAKMAASQRAIPKTPERMAMLRANLALGQKASISEEHKAKIAEANRRHRLGTTLSEVTKAKVSAARLGIPKSTETRARMSQVQKGRFVSPEHRAKISASVRRYFETSKRVPEQMEMFADGGPIGR